MKVITEIILGAVLAITAKTIHDKSSLLDKILVAIAGTLVSLSFFLIICMWIR